MWKKNSLGIFEQNLNQKISYPEDGNESCFTVEQSSPWFNQRNELILIELNKYAKSGDFLDIGGGNGFQAKAIVDSNYNGKVILIEPGTDGCRNAKKRGLDFVYQGFFQDFPFAEFSIGNCGLFDVIEHIEDDIKFLNQLYDKLNKDSRVFINVPALKGLWSETDELAGHFRRYNLSDLKRIEENTPFKLVDYSYYFEHYIIPLFIARVIPYRLGIRFGHEKLAQKEQRNLKNGKLDAFFNYCHLNSLNKVKQGKQINRGTSLFFVLEK